VSISKPPLKYALRVLQKFPLEFLCLPADVQFSQKDGLPLKVVTDEVKILRKKKLKFAI
jgi:hypothetical protein